MSLKEAEAESILQKESYNQSLDSHFSYILAGFYYYTFKDNLIGEPLCQKTVAKFLLEVDNQLQDLLSKRVLKQVVYRVDANTLLEFLTKHSQKGWQNLEIVRMANQDPPYYIELFLVSSDFVPSVLTLVKLEPRLFPPSKEEE